MGKKYSNYQVEDFLKDELFVKWVLRKENRINEFWSKWMEEHPEKIKIIKEASLIIQSIEYKEQATLDNGEYLQLYERIEESKVGPDQSVNRRSWKLYPFAAAIALLILASLIVLSQINTSKADGGHELSYTTKSTIYGEKLTVRLPDGSTVKLNAGSSITYPDDFTETSRSITLTGEAMFEVAKDESRPFIVQTTQMEVVALGTSFNVNSYDPKTHIVALIEGKVRVDDDFDNSLVLNPGQIAQTFSDKKIEVSNSDLEHIIAWSSGILLFDNETFQEVILKLKKWYGVEIEIEGQIPSFDEYEGTFDNENLETVLNTLSYSSGFEFEINKKTVKLIFNQ